MRRLIIVFALGAAACAPRVVWEQPGRNMATAERQRQIDTAECMAVAMQETALPAESAQMRVTVNFQGPGQSQTASPGQMTATADEMEARRLRTAALAEAETERQALAGACMLRRGWVKRVG